jgi:hypothetical protein
MPESIFKPAPLALACWPEPAPRKICHWHDWGYTVLHINSSKLGGKDRFLYKKHWPEF